MKGWRLSLYSYHVCDSVFMTDRDCVIFRWRPQELPDRDCVVFRWRPQELPDILSPSHCVPGFGKVTLCPDEDCHCTAIISVILHSWLTGTVLFSDGDPKNYLTYFRRATVYLALGKSRSALPDLNKVLELRPDFTAVRTFYVSWCIHVSFVWIMYNYISPQSYTGVALTFEKLRIANAQHGKNCVSSPAAKATISTDLPKIDKHENTNIKRTSSSCILSAARMACVCDQCLWVSWTS